jgi:hypothetical protein
LSKLQLKHGGQSSGRSPYIEKGVDEDSELENSEWYWVVLYAVAEDSRPVAVSHSSLIVRASADTLLIRAGTNTLVGRAGASGTREVAERVGSRVDTRRYDFKAA